MDLSSAALIRTGGKFLQDISQTAQICEDPLLVQPVCSVAEDFSPVTSPGESLLLSYHEEDNLYAICTAANEIFQGIYDDPSLSSFITRPVAQHYRDGLQRGFLDHEYEAVRNYIDGLRPTLEQSASDMLNTLNLEGEHREWMEGLYAAEIRFGLLTLRAFESCMRAPEVLRNGQYAQWDERFRTAQSERDAIEAERLKAQGQAMTPNAADRFRNSWWLFIIVLALSLKFGKGIAHLRKKNLLPLRAGRERERERERERDEGLDRLRGDPSCSHRRTRGISRRREGVERSTQMRR